MIDQLQLWTHELNFDLIVTSQVCPDQLIRVADTSLTLPNSKCHQFEFLTYPCHIQ